MCNKLILGDNLEIMKSMPSECVDLIYLDPPFFSNRNYEVIWGDKGEVRSFEDRWAGGIENYILWLKDRVREMYRLLKPTGSLYLHCDWHASHYIKVMILDEIFGYGNFRNEIVWCYKSGGATKKQFSRKHDIIFFYTKTNKWKFNYEKEKSYGQSGGGQGGKVKYFKDDEGTYSVVGVKDWWEISILSTTHPERIGYPTQKPIALLERIIKASSDEGDVVLDPFIGGGTTIITADYLNRRWIGIDQSVQAIKVSEMRFLKVRSSYGNSVVNSFTVELHKYDINDLTNMDAFEFERWIINQFGGEPNTKQRGDSGIDGKTQDNAPIQVKQSKNIGRNVIDNFKSAIIRYDKLMYDRNIIENKPVGYIIAFSFSKGAVEEVARLKNSENIMIKLIRVDEIIEVSNRPKLIIEFTEQGKDDNDNVIIQIEAKAESNAGIELYSWDLNYDEANGFNAEVIIDKKGKIEYSFPPGEYNIACKAVDADGLEIIEVVKLRVNGFVVRV
jgi:DNA modification methylase